MKDKRQKMKDLQTVRRRRITIQKRTITEDEYGNQIEDWTDWKTVPAQRQELYGEEYYTAKQLGEEQTIKWKLKYVEFLDEVNSVDYRVVDDRGEQQDIIQVDFLQDDGQWLILRCLDSDTNDN